MDVHLKKCQNFMTITLDGSDITIVTTSCWAGHTTSNSLSDLVVMSEASGSALIPSL